MEPFNGWCFNWWKCRGIGVECVRVDGCEVCRECAARIFGVQAEPATSARVVEANAKESQPC